MFESKKFIVVTGGASGIGKAICQRFSQNKNRILIVDKDRDKGAALVKELSLHNKEVSFFGCDISNHDQVKELSQMNPDVDVLINCAGISHIGTIETTDEEDFKRLFDVNVKGIFLVTKAIISHLKKKKKGVIINITSVAASVGIAERFAYSMTKGAVLSMTYSIAKDYVDYGIRCNSISPARIHTPFVDEYLKKHYPGEEAKKYEELSKTQPIGRMGKPEEVAELAFFLSSDNAQFITGTDFPIDGGFLKLNT
ncbi:MAG: SDR family NAD(P)-dependent oxidoreductase [Flavobacteriaceae bacterium]|nr:SDR family NAD(P)-dependent oxidoreductase [Flavobacteriaceae bacterium]